MLLPPLLLSITPAHAQIGPPGIKRDLSQADVQRASPGALLGIWPQVGGSVEHAKAYRILYRSTGLNGEPIVVSGAVFVPDAPLPASGKRDVIAWAHPTTGIVRRCAPSKLPTLSGTIAGLEEMLRRGFVVAATDYPGLGTTGIHPYLVGISEARSVLDSVRAARELPTAAAGNRFAVWGHSQGGHAALFTGEEAPRYAPELQLVGVAAAAPPTDLVALFKADQATTTQSGSSLAAMAVMAWSKVYGVPIDTMLANRARPAFEAVAKSCIQSVDDVLTLMQIEGPLKYRFLKADPTVTAPWRGLMEQNSPGGLPINVPVFIAQGLRDDLIHPSITRRYARRLCKSGTSVFMKLLNRTGHVYAGYASADAAVAWMADRFRGLPAPNGCGGKLQATVLGRW